MGILKRGSTERSSSGTQYPVTVGTVVDTNDPAQMGRLRVQCTLYGDNAVIDSDTERDQIPWATYVTPFGGTTNNIKRGPGDQPANDRASYGMWAIPKLGAQVVCMALDNNPSLRVWMGCIFPNNSPHSLPHGRYVDGNPAPVGSTEQPIDPLATNMSTSFGSDTSKYEWRSRAADYSVAAVDKELIAYGQNNTETTVPDDKDVEYKITADKTIPGRQGYAVNRAVALDGLPHPLTGGVAYDSGVYSWTSPGFHALSMDDRPENCRFKIRTTRGHQFILDDTNERVYLNTAQGNNWVEMDQNGNIDIFSTTRVSIHSVKEMNFTTDETFRVRAKKGIHLQSDEEIRIHSKSKDIHIRSDENIRTNAVQSIFQQAGQEYHQKSGAGTFITAAADINIKSSAAMKINSSGTMDVKSDSIFKFSGTNGSLSSSGVYWGSDYTTPIMSLNGHEHRYYPGPGPYLTYTTDHAFTPGALAPASAATDAQPPEEKQAFWTARVPEHEPWNRVMMKAENADLDEGNSHVPEFTYEDPMVGKKDRGETTQRNPFWHR